MDLVFIDDAPVLNDIETRMNCQDIAWGADKYATWMWKLLINCWAKIFTGYPDILRLDHECSFASETFRELAENKGVLLQLSRKESNKALEKSERYHASLRRIYKCIRHDSPDLINNPALPLPQKANNVISGPRCLLPSYLVFSQMPYIPGRKNSKRPM